MKQYDCYIVAANDLANTGYRTFRSLQAVGWNVSGGILRTHQFKYPEHLPVVSLEQMKKEAASAKIVFFITANKRLHKQLYPHIKGKVVIKHPGTTYRKHTEKLNQYWNKHIVKHLAVTPDLVNLGAKNSVYNGMKGFDVENIEPCYYTPGTKVIIGHFPSNTAKKGSSQILKVLIKLQKKYDFVISYQPTTVPYLQNIERMRVCDIIVEQLLSEMSGVKMGILGQQAFEAAAAGNIVVSNFYYEKLHKEKYGAVPEIVIANTAAALERKIIELVQMDDDEISAKQKAARRWMEQYHTFEKAGEVLKKDLEDLLCEK